MCNSANSLLSALRLSGDSVYAAWLHRYMQAGKGGYGEGDRFLGVRNPRCREIVREFREMPLPQIGRLLKSPWHEARLCGVLLLVERYRRGTPELQEEVVALYQHAADDGRLNNWDLIDNSAPGVVGLQALTHGPEVLRHYAESTDMWENRIAIVGTWPLIKHHDFAPTFQLVRKYLNHPHDLMHKACGWMLREIGKQDQEVLTAFLREYKLRLPRTTLRYALEHYTDPLRTELMARK
jgi:3-methyladenine DNA glycosylase AlkD